MSSDFYATSIVPFAPIIIKICRAYTNTQEDFEDYYQEVCLQIWRSHRSFDERAAWSTWIRHLVESNPGVRLVYGVPLILIVSVVVIAIVVELLGGIIFDFDVDTVYRRVFRKLDEIVAEMEELRS